MFASLKSWKLVPFFWSDVIPRIDEFKPAGELREGWCGRAAVVHVNMLAVHWSLSEWTPCSWLHPAFLRRGCVARSRVASFCLHNTPFARETWCRRLFAPHSSRGIHSLKKEPYSCTNFWRVHQCTLSTQKDNFYPHLFLSLNATKTKIVGFRESKLNLKESKGWEKDFCRTNDDVDLVWRLGIQVAQPVMLFTFAVGTICAELWYEPLLLISQWIL